MVDELNAPDDADSEVDNAYHAEVDDTDDAECGVAPMDHTLSTVGIMRGSRPMRSSCPWVTPLARQMMVVSRAIVMVAPQTLGVAASLLLLTEQDRYSNGVCCCFVPLQHVCLTKHSKPVVVMCRSQHWVCLHIHILH